MLRSAAAKLVPQKLKSAIRSAINGTTAHKMTGDIRSRLPAETIRTIFDIGANVGQTIVSMRAHYPLATIHSFEPNPATYVRLEHHAGTFVKTYNFGFGRTEGALRFDTVNYPDDRARVSDDQKDERMPIVQITTLDKFCKDMQY